MIIILRFFNVFCQRITLVLLNPQVSIFENTVDPEQLASDEVVWSGSVLFYTLIGLHAYKMNWCMLTGHELKGEYKI